MLRLFLALCVLGAVGAIAYQYLEESNTGPEGYYSRDYSSEAAPRPDYSRVPQGTPDVGAGLPQEYPPSDINCQTDLPILEENMRQAYSRYLTAQSPENYLIYQNHKEKYNWAIAQCWGR